jgi:hypothetical protein
VHPGIAAFGAAGFGGIRGSLDYRHSAGFSILLSTAGFGPAKDESDARRVVQRREPVRQAKA